MFKKQKKWKELGCLFLLINIYNSNKNSYMKNVKSIYKEFFKENYSYECNPFIASDGKYYVIYMILFPDGKYYIGEHITKRLNDGYAGSGSLLPEKYNKTEITGVKKIYLLFLTNKEEMQEREKQIIGESFKNDKKCLNLVPGGSDGYSYKMVKNSVNNRKGKKRTKESIEKQRLACTGKKHTEEEKRKISEWHKNFFKTDLGKKKKEIIASTSKNRIRTQEEKKKISDAQKNRFLKNFLKHVEDKNFDSAFNYALTHKKNTLVQKVLLENEDFKEFFYKKTHKEGPRKSFKMPPRTKEHCLKISMAKKGKKASNETRKKFSEQRQGCNNSNYCPKMVNMYDENWHFLKNFRDGISACEFVRTYINQKATTKEIFVACRTGKTRYKHKWKFSE